MPKSAERLALAAAALGCSLWALLGPAPAVGSQPGFAAEVARLSEASGFFDTDNLISNEQSYLEVIPSLVERGLQGGAYIGVGPDQNFSYIARIRPSVAYIVDVRRDNLLLHLLFRALFAESRTRVEYLSRWTGRAPPSDAARWTAASLEEIVAYVDRTDRSVNPVRTGLDRTVAAFGVPLSASDHETIRRFHQAFAAGGLSLRFHSHGRPPQPSYPTLRQLLLATDRRGTAWNYLASEDDFQFVRRLQAAGRIIPVVGDLAGPHALAAIAETLAAKHEPVSAFYVSNVEFYLSGPRYGRFLDNLKRLPRRPGSVMIRSIFGGGSSRSLVQPLDDVMR